MKILKFNESVDNILDTIKDYLTPISDDFKTEIRKIDNSLYEIRIDKEFTQKISSVEDIDQFLLNRSKESDIILGCKEFLFRINAESFSFQIHPGVIILSLEFAEKLNKDAKFMVNVDITLKVCEQRLKSILLSDFGSRLSNIDEQWDEWEEKYKLLFLFDQIDNKPEIINFIYESNKDYLEEYEEDDTYHHQAVVFWVRPGVGTVEIVS